MTKSWYFSRLDPFPKGFGQAQAKIMQCFVEIVAVYFIVAYTMVFILLCDRDLWGGVLKLMRNAQYF